MSSVTSVEFAGGHNALASRDLAVTRAKLHQILSSISKIGSIVVCTMSKRVQLLRFNNLFDITQQPQRTPQRMFNREFCMRESHITRTAGLPI